MKRVLTIAGSDSGGGAGIQADLKTITVLGGYGMSVLTALTAQNTLGVQGIFELPPSFVEKQIDSVLSDIGADAVKTGMLANRKIVELVARKIRAYRVKKVVVDPVMVAKSGDTLLQREARDAVIQRLLPLATVVTPNLPEASALSGKRIRSLDDMKRAALEIHRLGARNVVVKGGHLKGDAVDVLYDGRAVHELRGPRIETRNTHGTGCTFASAIATCLAQGKTVLEATKDAKAFITRAVEAGLPLGKGVGPTNPFAAISREIDRYRVIDELKKAIQILKELDLGYLIPEVSSNLGYGLPWAKSFEDVAGFPGRIVQYRNTIATLADPDFGASRHIARIILTVMRSDPEYRSAMNIRFSKDTVTLLKRRGYHVASFDRRLEPKAVKEKEGSSLEWGVGEVLKREKTVPDFIYDLGDVGKEPMIRVLGKTPLEVVRKIEEAFLDR